ncbi:formyl transferase [Faecalibacter bovis]|uniref:phosphoribosylglycinamide formyltransferase 1 n=1 Tax=Faecalibacter bovis TaxID=2898187 RepID=A0ABX7X9N5_9FLAO|nr:formyl transferase [Faecalibacter bovis]QTV04591.1 hypothetical protein J9309_07120 [Faecalibacter bovis]
MDKKIVMLTGEAISTRYMYNGLKDDYDIQKVIQEVPVSMKKILKNRAKRIGYFQVFGQILFGILVLPFLRKISKEKLISNRLKLNLSDEHIPEDKLIKVDSVNDKKTIEILKQLNPDIVIVNGCRIISKRVLEQIDAVFINTHEGVTPRYRGIHGAYWALVNQDKENCGVTVHLVDKGVDTGGILYQGIISIDDNDNFTTYPIYQTAKGIELMKLAITDYYNGELKTIQPKLESKIWYHPTIWKYFYNWIFKGVN